MDASTEHMLRRIAEKRREKTVERQIQIRERKKRAAGEIERLTGLFRKADADLERVILFGSLAEDRVTSLAFDIDLAVDCTPEAYLRLVTIGLDSGFKVDVVELATASPPLKHAILEHGKVIWTRTV